MEWNIYKVAQPKTMARDQLWDKGPGCLQLEFVFDNQSLACIANGTVGTCNDYYRAPLDLIRIRIAGVFGSAFNYRAGFF